MRPAVLNHGYGLGPRLLFRLIRLMSGHPAPDAAKLTFYRSDFYGTHAKQFIRRRCAVARPGRWATGS